MNATITIADLPGCFLISLPLLPSDCMAALKNTYEKFR